MLPCQNARTFWWNLRCTPRGSCDNTPSEKGSQKGSRHCFRECSRGSERCLAVGFRGRKASENSFLRRDFREGTYNRRQKHAFYRVRPPWCVFRIRVAMPILGWSQLFFAMLLGGTWGQNRLDLSFLRFPWSTVFRGPKIPRS